jgi:sulfide:quinone oxidoreductase
MKNLLILGGGTAGTMAANKLRKELRTDEWSITVVDSDDQHRYQPGYLFMPFGTYQPEQVTKSRRKFLRKDIPLVYGEIDVVKAEDSTVVLTDGRTCLPSLRMTTSPRRACATRCT